MALTTVAQLQSQLATPFGRQMFIKQLSVQALSITNGFMTSSWTMVGQPVGAAPGPAAGGTAVNRLCDRTTVGSLGQTNAPGGKELRAFVKTIQSGNGSLPLPLSMILCDRIADYSSFDPSVLTTQTTGMTASYTRYNPATDNIRAAIECFTSVGSATTPTATITYTNQSGTSGQVSPTAPQIAGGFQSFAITGGFKPISLAAGDTGFSTVDSVTLTASNGAVGNIGVCLYKPLVHLHLAAGFEEPSSFDPLERLGGYLPLIKPDACLFWLFSGCTAGTYPTHGEVGFISD